MIPVYKPYISELSGEYARKAIESSWISSIGEYIEKATEKLSFMTGSKYTILVNNGTSATHLVAKTLFRFHPEVKRVLVPSACYVAAYNSLLYDGVSWDIECVDLNLHTWNMNLDGFDVLDTDAIFAVHNLGNIINVPLLKRNHRCVVIEDNCEGMFGRYDGVCSGTASLCSSLSFFGNKNITCGEGGAFMTNDEEVYKFITKVKGQGQTNKRYIHDVLGYNYRMTNIQAAILLGQLETSDFIFDQKRHVFDRYRKNLCCLPDIDIQANEDGCEHSMWMFGVRFQELTSYDIAHRFFMEAGIETRPMFYPYTAHSHLNMRGDDSIARLVNNSVVILPSYGELTDEQIDYICEKVIELSRTLHSRECVV
jgi:perosamine synthetase